MDTYKTTFSFIQIHKEKRTLNTSTKVMVSFHKTQFNRKYLFSAKSFYLCNLHFTITPLKFFARNKRLSLDAIYNFIGLST